MTEARYCRPKLRRLAIASASAQVSASLSLERCLASMSHVAAISRRCSQSSGFAASFASLRHSSARLVQSVDARMRTPSPDAMKQIELRGVSSPGRLMPKISLAFAFRCTLVSFGSRFVPRIRATPMPEVIRGTDTSPFASPARWRFYAHSYKITYVVATVWIGRNVGTP